MPELASRLTVGRNAKSRQQLDEKNREIDQKQPTSVCQIFIVAMIGNGN